ncbi:MAG TPA: translation elongation factor 4 [Planctomycetota bacterium]|nr:translation elongation factor 4 [Planctomycetota bacterium]
MAIPIDRIRNFCIIAHIDHGKSTLADRILEKTGAVTAREARPQTLDAMDLERERGITIKAKAVHLTYKQPLTGETYHFNLIDTPGHVDFNYEVSRSLAACEGAILLVDATQGVQAQTVANCYLAIEAGLEIIPAVNKVDIQSARPEEVKEEMSVSLGIDPREVMHTSGKTGAGVEELLDRVIARVPPPKGDPEKPLRALIFDSVYDDYKGVVMYLRLKDGKIKLGDKIRLLATNRTYDIIDLGQNKPKPTSVKELSAGDAGYICAGIKTMSDVKVGDTVTLASAQGVEPLPGYKEPLSMVFCGIYPTNNADFPELRKALERLKLNDSSFTFQPETSEALGFGFRCGFLGLLHMEIVQERLERESDIDLVQTAPNVTYEILTTRGEVLQVDNPARLPDESVIEEFREPMVRASIVTPADSIGAIMKINEEKRAIYKKTEYLSPQRVILQYDIPLGEIIYDYYDMLKSASHGYASLDYEVTGYTPGNLVKLRILVNGVEVDALTTICHRDKAEHAGREILKRLRKEIPRHLFEVPLQAAIGGKIIARENIKAMGKNVTSKCYGGDITRKRKLLEKQKEGKKRMKSVGNVEIPQKAFLAVLGEKGD